MTTTTTITTSRKTKAALCAGAAFALLLGGGSTYAAWSQNGDLGLDPADISTGEWSFDLDATTDWYDVSPETGSTPVAITLADFPLVPGDKIQGVTTVDAVNLTLDAKGTHLKAEVSELSVKSNASTAVEWLRADADVVDGEVVVTIEFPYDKDNNYATESGHPVAVNLGKLTVTVTQVRPALD